MKDTGKTVFSVAVIMMLTKAITLIGNLLYMAYFGVTEEINIYDYALTVPNIIFNCIGTALNTVVIPIYLTLKAKKDEAGAKAFLDDIITISSALILLLVALGYFISPAIMKMAGFDKTPEQLAYAVFALRVLLPVMWFHGVNYVFQGVLQANGRFKLPAFVSAPSAIVIIGYVLILGDRFGVTGLLYATLIGLSLQPLIMVPAIKSLGYRYRPSFGVKSEAIVSAGKATLPVLVSVSSYQINMMFNSTLASRFGTNSIMRYIQNITLVSILSIIYAIASVYFPLLTKRWASEDKDGFKTGLSDIIAVIAFLLIPASIGFALLRNELGDFLANWGNIGGDNVLIASRMLGLYGAGVCAVGLKEILDKAFYAQKDTRTPAIFGFVIMAANVALSLLLLNSMGTYSMPLAYSLSSFIGVFGLIAVMNKRVRLLDRTFISGILKCIAAALIMGFVLYFEIPAINGIIDAGAITGRILRIFIPVASGVAIYFIAAASLKIPQAKQVINMVQRKAQG